MERWRGGGVVHGPVYKHLWIVQCVYKYIHTYLSQNQGRIYHKHKCYLCLCDIRHFQNMIEKNISTRDVKILTYMGFHADFIS